MDKELRALQEHISVLFSRMEDRLMSLESKLLTMELSTMSAINKRKSFLIPPIDDFDFEMEPSTVDVRPHLTLKRQRLHQRKKLCTVDALTCVQCSRRYQESDNTGCSCIYHPGELMFVAEHKYVLSCCQVPVKNRQQAKKAPGCTKGRHCNLHHTQFTYVNYFIHMNSLSMDAQELWLTADIMDPVTQCSEWGEVGLANDGKVYIVVGYAREQPIAYKELSFQDLKECKTPQIELIRKSSTKGWIMTVSLHAAKSIAKCISVSLKAAGYKSPLVKRLQLVCSGDSFRPGSVDTLSDPTPPIAKPEYRIPADVLKGPMLSVGKDFSVETRNDYLTEQNDFPLILTQLEITIVDSSHIRQSGGKWNNLFTTKVMVSNSSDADLIVDDIHVQYHRADTWIECDQVWIAFNEGDLGRHAPFSVAAGQDIIMRIRTAIAVQGALPVNEDERQRAHYSLPQPLLFKLSFVGSDRLSTASLRFEQGNCPLNLVTRRKRETDWNEGGRLAFYIFADDVKCLRRSDVALYYNTDGMLVYRACPYGVEAQELLLTKAMLTSAAHTAKRYRNPEQELTLLRKKQYGSCVRVFCLVDLELAVTYALKIHVSTPSSHSTGYLVLPRDDFSSSSVSIQPDSVPVNGRAFLLWSTPRASQHDRLSVYTEHGRYSVMDIVNDQAATSGAKQIQVPSTLGRYQIRYYPAWLTPSNSDHQHATFTSMTCFTTVGN